MSYLSNRISGLTQLQSFTTTVIQDNSGRYNNTTGKATTFQVGYEYTGINLYKGASRPPKVRILAVFMPLISGSPNANNDTYVAFQVYDYTLARFRGPYCRRARANDPYVYYDFYLTPIDKFGKNYGNLFTSDSGSSISTFTAPSPSFSSNTTATIGGVSRTINSGHYSGCYTFAGSRNTTIDFNGFFSLSGLNGTYCFYTLADNGSPKTFRNTLNDAKYTSNVYPYVTPKTNKFINEWRCSPMCGVDNAGYTPLVRPTSRGPIKYVLASNPDPGSAFNAGITEPTDVWVFADYPGPLDFFGGKLFSNGGGAEGSGGYAPAGYYGISDATYYGYWDGNGNWGTIVDWNAGGGGGGASLRDFIFLGPYLDPFSACAEDGRAEPYVGYTDINQSVQPDGGQTIYEADGSTPVSWLQPGAWYKVFDGTNTSLGYVITADPSAMIDNKFRCE